MDIDLKVVERATKLTTWSTWEVKQCHFNPLQSNTMLPKIFVSVKGRES